MSNKSKKKRNSTTVLVVLIGSVIVAAILGAGTVFLTRSARSDTERAAHSVSLLYLDELAGRREQVVSANLRNRIRDIKAAVDLMTDENLSDEANLRAYQLRMKRLYNLEKFAFVDTSGVIYTSLGTRDNIADYSFDYKTIDRPNISVLNLKNAEKKVVIAVPVEKKCGDTEFCVCFMEIDASEMLSGLSMSSGSDDATFCNIYTTGGVALTNEVLGGLAIEDNLLEAMKIADLDDGYTYDMFIAQFTGGQRGEVSFTYNGIEETLSYVPVDGTDWMLTYLIRESVIAEEIGAISDGIVVRSVIQSGLTALAIVVMFVIVIVQLKKNSRLELEKETTETEHRVKSEEMEHKLALQEKLLNEEKQRTEQTKMITALSSDYRSVYYVELDRDEGVCYQNDGGVEDGVKVGEHFPFTARFTEYAEKYVSAKNREDFLAFIRPENIKEGLREDLVISIRYTVERNGAESYEMLRFAGVRHPADRDDGVVHAVGAGFTNVDAETRKQIEQNNVLAEALEAAKQASRAKTAFLSSMSHEIRTPMNAIIGLDSIALSDPDISDTTRDRLTKIGDSAEHLLRLINDILDMSRIESGRLILKNEEFSFTKLLETINTMFGGQCDERGLEYDCKVKGEVDRRYIGDNMKLRQVLINILGNAVKFTPSGGRVSLTVERIAEFEGKSTLRFVIEDTGIGMSAEFLPHIFDAFSQEDSSATNKYGSSGLGLAITKRIVEMMNGNIAVESEKGKGTRFTVTVTLMDSEHDEADDVEVDVDNMTVLVVDDDPVACEHAKLVLTKAGVASETALSGEEAIEMVKLRHARREPYNLILVDWKMPEMDGVETTRRIRELVGHESAIIILTAYKWDDVIEEALGAGVDSFVAKPLFAGSVLEEFRDAVRRKTKESGKAAAELSGKRVLVAEDVEVNAEIICMILEMRGVKADVAENGRVAVEKFAEHEPGYYSAVLMDMRMPEMDGLEATRTIRAMEDRPDAKEIPIIALTANAFDEDVQRSLQAGLNAHLSKPVKPEALFETLEELIKR